MATNSSSIVILPFQMLAENSVSNAFDNQDNSVNLNSDSKQVFESFVKYLKTLPIKSDKIVDSSKYHDYISNYINQESDENNNSFLKTFTIDLGKLKGININEQEITFASQFQNHNLFLGESNLELKFDKITIVLNEIAQLGYFILKIDYIVDDDNTLKSLSEIDFYRYYKPKEVLDYKNKLNAKYAIKTSKDKKDREGNINVEINHIALFEIIETYFSFISTSAYFIYTKPIMLHLFSKINIKISSEDELINTCYKVLRIPPTQIGQENQLQDQQKIVKLHYPDTSIAFCTMSEGAIILDTSTENSSTNTLLNKYLPSFILALNQREVMLKTAKDVSQIANENLYSADKKTIAILGELRKKLNLIQLKQVFYNISLYNEIEMFFIELQKKFGIDILLQDNNGSIEAIHSLLESERIANEAKENKSEEQAQKKRDDNLALILGVVGLFGAASAVIDVYNFYSSPSNESFWWLPSSFVLCMGSYLVWFYKKKK